MNGYAPSSGLFEFFTFVVEPKSKQKRVRSLLHVETEPMATLTGRWPFSQLAASFKMGSQPTFAAGFLSGRTAGRSGHLHEV